MLEPKNSVAWSSIQKDLDALQQRASYQRRKFRQFNQLVFTIREFVASLFSSPLEALHRLPSRYLLHVIVALIVPVALSLTYLPTIRLFETSKKTGIFAETPTELGPLSVDQRGSVQIGDPPLPETDALPMPISLVSRRDALAPVVVPSSIAFERVRIRNGPGLEYDDVGILAADTPVQVIGRHGEWLQVRQKETGPTYWVAGELLTISKAAIYTLFEVPDKDIPAPPPPKIGTVNQDNLNLRDGPGTNYVSMVTLDAGYSYTLIERYKDWMHIATANYDGWVNTQYLDMAPGVLNRIPETMEIPDPNPAMVANIVDDSVNLREGPGTVYGTVATVDADTTVRLVARHDNWFKVETLNGTTAWVFSDLLQMSRMVERRVPYTDDIPPKPRPEPVRVASRSWVDTRGDTGGGDTGSSGRSNGYAAVDIPASGDVASYAMQFVGYPYVYGGASPGGGFDCSGLVQYVYRQYGVYLPRVAASQYSTAYGAAVGSMDNLAPGDLVFFAGTAGPGISHVAMYIGGGRMVHAMTPSLGVGVSNVWDSYWVGHYYGAIRPYR